MKTIHMLDEKDVREEVAHVLSESYDGKDWCEDGSIRQDIKDLKSDVDGLRVTIQELVSVSKDIKTLKNLVDNNLTVLARHDDKLNNAITCIQTLNKMLEIISKRVGLNDESE